MFPFKINILRKKLSQINEMKVNINVFEVVKIVVKTVK